MAYPSITSRTIVIPELDTSFYVNNVELSITSPELARLVHSETLSDQELMNNRLASLSQQIFNVSSVNVISFSRWKEINVTLSQIFDDPEFNKQILESYSGKHEKAEKVSITLESNRKLLMQLQNSYPDAPTFAQGFTRSGLLNPYRQRRARFGLDSANPSLMQSVYSDLSERGVSELELENWENTSRTLTSSVLPSAKAAFEALKTYEFPVASSPPTEKYTMAEFQGAVRAVALTTLRRSTYLTVPGAIVSAATGLGWTYALVCLLGGPITCLSLISVAQVAPLLEDWIRRIPR